MTLSFYGAAQEVTGSCHCLETNGKKILVDCGLQQGQDEKDDQKLPFAAADIDFVVLTHAHIDHSGRIPLLVKEGFDGKIFATKATCDLIAIMLRDSAHIQEMDAMRDNRKLKRAERMRSSRFIRWPMSENLKITLHPAPTMMCDISEVVKDRFVDAGLSGLGLGRNLSERGCLSARKTLSGDIGNLNQPSSATLVLKQADNVVRSETYGDRNHEKSEDLRPTG